MVTSIVEHLRPRLFGLAYRMLGVPQDAEDVVQDAMLRWQRVDATTVRDAEAWLVSVVTRLAIDRLRHASVERATYPGPWLPEPIADDRYAPDRNAELASDLSMAFLVLLERLAPDERAAFLLREVFDADYEDIARTLDKTPAAVRQTVHRARERVRADRARFAVPPDAKERLFQRFLRALETDDRDGMMAVLAADATWTADGGGKATAARRVVVGAERIARMLIGIERKYGHPFRYAITTVNGEPALAAYAGDALYALTFCRADGERMTDLYRVMNPDKLRGIVDRVTFG
jgi:RNA polymerase sigma-70 factor (ECF subfamily)